MILVCLKVRNKIKQSYKGFAWSVNFRYLNFTSKTINSFEEYGERKDNTDITGQKNISKKNYQRQICLQCLPHLKVIKFQGHVFPRIMICFPIGRKLCRPGSSWVTP